MRRLIVMLRQRPGSEAQMLIQGMAHSLLHPAPAVRRDLIKRRHRRPPRACRVMLAPRLPASARAGGGGGGIGGRSTRCEAAASSYLANVDKVFISVAYLILALPVMYRRMLIVGSPNMRRQSDSAPSGINSDSMPPHQGLPRLIGFK